MRRRWREVLEAEREGLCMISHAFDLESIADRLQLSGFTAHATSVRELARHARRVAKEIEAIAPAQLAKRRR